jgi:serine/threonine protein kinase
MSSNENNFHKLQFSKINAVHNSRKKRNFQQSPPQKKLPAIHLSTLREMKLMTATKHKNLMQFRDIFVENNQLHIVMPFLDLDLDAVISKRLQWSVMQVRGN